MAACGPFTVNNELSYEGLKDLMVKVREEQPHALVLSGPFLSVQQEDVFSGDLRYRDLETGELCFMGYDELTQHIFNYVNREIGDLQT